jgi:Tol biopolymer transport system component
MSDQYEATPTFTPDGRELYFMQSDPKFARYRLFRSRCENGAWTRATPAAFAAPDVQEGDPGVTADGKRLYYISMPLAALGAANGVGIEIFWDNEAHLCPLQCCVLMSVAREFTGEISRSHRGSY